MTSIVDQSYLDGNRIGSVTIFYTCLKKSCERSVSAARTLQGYMQLEPQDVDYLKKPKVSP